MNRNFTILIVHDDPPSAVKHEETLPESEVKERLTQLVPECNINWEMVLNDKRCSYFQHYMPVNTTSAKHSYSKNHKLFTAGNRVKVYISERFDV